MSCSTIERLRDKVRELWRSCQSKTSTQMRDQWKRYVRGWWEYYRLTGNSKQLVAQDGWIRRHVRKCFWQRWHNSRGRINALRKLGVTYPLLRTSKSGRGAWRMAQHPLMQKGLNNRLLRRHGFLSFADLISQT